MIEEVTVADNFSEVGMVKVMIVLAVGFALAACQSAEGQRREAAYVQACLDGNDAACRVLEAWGRGNAAAMQNFTTSTKNFSDWTIQQQRVPTYSGGGNVRTCSTNPLSGVQSCY